MAMTVGDLKRMLEKYPDDMELLNDRCSDWDLINESDWSVVYGVRTQYGVMRSHQTMSADNKAKEKAFLHLMGN